MEYTKGNTKKNPDESPIPMIVLLIMIGLGAIGIVYFVVLG